MPRGLIVVSGKVEVKQRGEGKEGAWWSPLFAQRAGSEAPRWTRTVGNHQAPLHEEGRS